jgi:hypothetical protein
VERRHDRDLYPVRRHERRYHHHDYDTDM